MQTLIFVGPAPLPVNGYSTITNSVRQEFSKFWEVHSCVTSGSVIACLFRCVRTVVRLLVCKPQLVYVALSGGARQALDLLVIAAARLRGARVVFHHHSFSYLDSFSYLTALCVAGSGDIHIVLSPSMKEKLAAVYDGLRDRTVIVSNAAFVEGTAAARAGGSRESDELVLGYLSNITREKGIFHFLQVVRTLSKTDIPIKALVAGPVEPSIAEEVREQIVDLPNVRYVGAVYAETKHDFFSDIDVLVFPTLYRNEAEPVVIWEALSSGVPVIAYERGCIGDILREQVPCCKAVSPTLGPDALMGEIQALYTATEFQRRSESSVSYFEQSRSAARKSFADLLSKLNDACAR